MQFPAWRTVCGRMGGRHPRRRCCAAAALGLLGLLGCMLYSPRFFSGAVSLAGSLSGGGLTIAYEEDQEAPRPTLARGLTVHNLSVDVGGMLSITADHLSLRYDLGDVLWHRRLEVSELRADRLEVALQGQEESEGEPEMPPEPEEAPSATGPLNLPLDIAVDTLSLENFAFLSEAVDVRVERFGGVLGYDRADNLAVLQKTEVKGVSVELKDGPPEEQPLIAAAAPEPEPEPDGEAYEDPDVIGFKLNLPLSIEISPLRLEDFAYLSTVVDVRVERFEGMLGYTSADNTATLRDTTVSGTEVHLKLGGGEEASAAGDSAAAGRAQPAAAARSGGEEYPEEALADGGGQAVQAAAASGPAPAQPQAGMAAGESGGGEAGPLVLARGADQAAMTDLPPPLVVLPTINLPLDVVLDNFRLRRARYHMEGLDTEECDADISIEWHDATLQVGQLSGRHPQFDLEVSGIMQFEKQYRMENAVVSLRGHEDERSRVAYDGLFYRQDLDVTANGDLGWVDLKLEAGRERHETSAQLEIALSPLDFAGRELKIEGDIGYFAYPLGAADKKLSIRSSHIRTSGRLARDVALDFRALFTGFGFENFDVEFAGLASLQRLQLQTLAIHGVYQEARVGVDGGLRLDYASGYGLAIEGLRASLSDAEFLSGYLAGPAALQVQLSAAVDEAGQPSVDVRELSGSLHLNGRQARLEARDLTLDAARRLGAGHFSFTHGPGNRVSMHGSSADTLAAEVSLERLGDLVDELRGSLQVSSTLQGTLDEFVLKYRGGAPLLKFGEAEMNSLTYHGSLDSSDWSFEVSTVAETVRLVRSLQASRDCTFSLSGHVDEHDLHFGCSGSNFSEVAFTGTLNPESHIYELLLTTLNIGSQYLGSLSLEKRAAMTLNYEELSGKLSDLALSGPLGRIGLEYTEFSLSQEHDLDTALKLKIPGFELANLELLGVDRELFAGSGAMSLELDLAFSNLGRIMDLSVPDMHLTAKLGGEELSMNAGGLALGFDKLMLEVHMDELQADASLQTQLSGDNGQLDIGLSLAEPFGSRMLDGHIRLDALSLALFAAPAASALEALTGTADMDVEIRGSLADTDSGQLPELHGTIALAGTAAPRVNIGELRGFEVKVQAAGHRGRLDGQVDLNDGTLSLEGDLNWSRGPNGTLHATTQALPLNLLGYGTARLDADTTVRYDGERAEVSGSLSVPSARIEVSTLGGGGTVVSPSSDEEIIRPGQQSAAAPEVVTPPLDAVLDVDFSLGEDVRLYAYGLNTFVNGGLKLTKAAGSQEISAAGVIALKEGNVAAPNGRNYVLRKAESRFSGSLLNPQLDVEVMADPDDLEDDVEVGVKVSGYAEDPAISYISQPSMSDNEVYSYMMYGYGLEKASASQDANDSNMMLGMGLSGVAGLANNFMGRIGLSGVRLRSQGTGDDSQVAVQGYVNRRTMLSYGYGLFNSVGEFRLRYELLRRLYVQFATSLDQAVDLIYSFEFE